MVDNHLTFGKGKNPLSSSGVAIIPENESKNQSNNVTPFVISSTDVSTCSKSTNMDHRRPIKDSSEEIPIDILKPALHLTALSGQDLYPPGYLTKRQKNLFIVFKSIVSLFLIWNIIRLYFSFYHWMGRGKVIVFSYFLLFYSLDVFKHGMKIITNVVYGRKLLEKFSACVVSLREQKYLRKVKLHIKLMVGFSVIIIIVSIIWIVISSYNVKFEPSPVKSLLGIPMWKNKTFESINFGILSWFVASGILSDDILLYFFAKVICCELHALSQKLKLLHEEEQSTSDINNKLVHIQKKYEEIMELLHQVNANFSIYAIIIFMFAIIFSCMLIVIAFQEDVNEKEIMIATFNTSLHIVLAISVLYSGISIQLAVEEPVEYLYRLSLNKEHSQDTMTRISLFFARVSNPSYLTAAKMFNIDSSTILMISGTLLSYGVIVFQTSSVHTGDKNASMTVLTGNMTGNATFG
ncbi:uncharacterized protein LOC106874590 isoform X2 [Octopus bimaculoides]|uniref:uncharacterized protein LOC106874590 isoform X2 n=1 Tax=Octopus bimaculoides TaxID=37653 RepID=UPI0022E4ECE0|nr:uncharacterized protein LOC106874590 isoform X2 [Octopus bimaculoides]